jgi:acetyltransferase-like isoleucine patch superfamily enzyme/coenzyme F420-reducing hydrogenase beta subunit
MIEITNKINCCGCNACGDVCTQNAVAFKTDKEGFWYPVFNKESCNNCGLCERVCPIINADKLKKNDLSEPVCFAAQHKNLESLFDSTSGSAFSAFAEKIYKDGGYVGGAVFNDDFSVRQFISNDKDDLSILRNTKYVQSNSEGFYIQVKNLLKEGNKVLVCGLPCQMAALRSFLRKDYDNLIIVDVICLGINSPKILPAYLKWQEQKHKSKIVYYKAKNKELGWRQLTTKIVFENGEVEYDKRDTNYFTVGFIGTHAFARPSCYDCKFKGFPRIADITIGDFWGAEKYAGKELDHDLGTSVVIVNSSKGKAFYESMKSKFKDKEVTLESVVEGNGALINSIPQPDIDREEFYSDLDTKPFEEFAKKYIKLPKSPTTSRAKLRNLAIFLSTIRSVAGFSLKTWWQNIYYNFMCKQIGASVVDNKYIVFYKHCVLNIAKTAKVNLNGIVRLGAKRVKGSQLETRLLVDPEAELSVGSANISYGAEIEVFRSAKLELGDGLIFNINATIICGDHITIGNHVCFGRDVTVRDNNGGHYISRKVYKDKRPITIGQHSWICEKALIMPGARIGNGAIIGANSMISGRVPNFSMTSSHQAQIVDENIFWKA